MKIIKQKTVFLLAMACFFMGVHSSEITAKKPLIKVLATGGGITAKLAGVNTSMQFSSQQIGVSNLINQVVEISRVADIDAEQISMIPSQEMSNEIWLKLAKRVDRILKSKRYDGIVITHGTDTMEETAYFLNLVCRHRLPIVFVGATRPTNHLSPDGPSNLYDAVVVAGNPKSREKGVMVVMNGKIMGARDVTKRHTYGTDSMQTTDTGFLGYVVGDDVYYYQESTRKHTFKSEFSISVIETLPRVDIVYGYANNSASMINGAINDGAKGIIYAGVGNGNFHPNLIEGFKHATDRTVRVVRSSRIHNGIVLKNAEVKDDDPRFRFIVGDNLNPQKARALLMVALTKTKDPKKIQTYFDNY